MYSKIIVPLDGSALAECALSHAEGLARGLNVKLVLLEIVPYPEVRDAAVESDWAIDANSYLADVAEDLQKNGVKEVEVVVQWGEVPEAIIAYAQSDPNALVVMSTHGRTGLARLAFGSVTESVLRSAVSVPVLVTRCFPESQAS